MIVMETITDTPWSADLSGHSFHNAFSTSTSSSTEPRKKFLYTAGVTSMSNSGPHESQTLPPARPRNVRRSQASRSQTVNSAARCRVILGKELKLVKNKRLSKAQTQPENTQVGDSVNFRYSAMNPAARVSLSATRTVTSTLLAKDIYRSNTSVRAIDKKGSYVHYLGRKIRLLKSKMASYVSDVDKEINLFNSKIDSYTRDLNREMNLMDVKITPYTRDLKRKINLLNSKVDSYCRDIGTVSIRMNSKMCSYSDEVSINFKQLKSKIGPYIHDVDAQMELMDSKLTAYNQDFSRKLELMYSNAEPFFQIKKEIKKFIIKQWLKCKKLKLFTLS